MGRKKSWTRIRQMEAMERKMLYGSLKAFDRAVRMYLEERYSLTQEIPDRDKIYAYLVMRMGGRIEKKYAANLAITKAIRSIKRSAYREQLQNFLRELKEAIEPVMEKYSDIPESTRYVWARTLLRAMRNKNEK